MCFDGNLNFQLKMASAYFLHVSSFLVNNSQELLSCLRQLYCDYDFNMSLQCHTSSRLFISITALAVGQGIVVPLS